ncbi:sigma-70 family RNA polymerase sigma factor [Prauserella endophytica]|uniref:Sigma-70 family RNA polymerase sigma factor n=2 Tax=Prauserella endophytica TaxID=1592324 RepID=A0ABY2RV04_9PSEU|nr:sigma-70 family RNA polymerase sigma factor [Prauserella endophytica]
MQDVDAVAAIEDPMKRAAGAHTLVTDFSAAVNEASRVRRESLEELVGQYTHAAIAEHLNITRARVGQLLKSGPRPERAMLGYGELTVALGGKSEGDKEKPGPVVSTDDLGGYQLVSDTARELGLSARYEVVQPPGMIDLNRDNLIVACGPRLSPLIAQVLHADRRFQFAKDQDGWHLIDRETDTIHRSPMDSGENRDYGYLARLPRFDGGGTFLYAAGVHAPGVSGALHYLTNNLAELYNQVKLKRFSMLVSCEFDPDTRRIQTSEALTPAHVPEHA